MIMYIRPLTHLLVIFFGLVAVYMPSAQLATSGYPGRSVALAVTTSRQLFFPPGVFSNREWSDQFTVEWYSKYLEAMGETPLYDIDKRETEGYRLLVLPSFDHPQMVRIEKQVGQYILSTKELNGAGGYEPGTQILDRTRVLNSDEVEKFYHLLDLVNYWRLPTRGLSGLDGTDWILEATRGSRYHIVVRWCPVNTAYRQLCRYMYQLAGL